MEAKSLRFESHLHERRHKFGVRTAQRGKEGYKGKIIPQTVEGRRKETIKDPAEGKKHAEKEKADEKSRGSQGSELNVKSNTSS